MRKVNLRGVQQAVRYAEFLPRMLLGVSSEDRLPGSTLPVGLSAAGDQTLTLLGVNLSQSSFLLQFRCYLVKLRYGDTEI